MEIHIGNRVAEVELVSKEDNKVVLTIDGKPFEADVVMAENGTCNILMDGRSSNAQLIRRDNGKSYKVNTHYSSFNVEIVDSQAKYLRMRKKGEEEQNDCIISPMPGKVVKIPVVVGQEMKAGDTVIVIEAMADAAVADGMPRPQAYKFAAQAVMGSAKMVLETGKHPGELKDMVCSPAGTTIEAVQVLEERGFRSAIIEAMRVCAEKSRNM